MPRVEDNPQVKAHASAEASAQAASIQRAVESVQQRLGQDFQQAMRGLRSAGAPDPTTSRAQADVDAAFDALRDSMDALGKADVPDGLAHDVIDALEGAADAQTVTKQVEELAEKARRVAETPLDVAASDEDLARQISARDAARQELESLGAVRNALDAATAARQAVRATEEAALRQEYQALTSVIAPYEELRTRTGEFNARVRELYDVSERSLEYSGLRLDAEHFIDKRFFKDFERQFNELGITSESEMPAFAVHTEYHIRNLESLSKKAQIPPDQALHGSSLTQEKLEAIQRGNYPTLLSLFEAFEDFWKSKHEVTVRGTTHELQSSYWKRLEPEFERLKDEAREKGL